MNRVSVNCEVNFKKPNTLVIGVLKGRKGAKYISKNIFEKNGSIFPNLIKIINPQILAAQWS